MLIEEDPNIPGLSDTESVSDFGAELSAEFVQAAKRAWKQGFSGEDLVKELLLVNPSLQGDSPQNIVAVPKVHDENNIDRERYRNLEGLKVLGVFWPMWKFRRTIFET